MIKIKRVEERKRRGKSLKNGVCWSRGAAHISKTRYPRAGKASWRSSAPSRFSIFEFV